MFTGNFQTPADPDIGPGILTGTITAMIVRDTSEAPAPGEVTSLLEPDDPFSVELDWNLAGPLVWTVGGYWVLGLYIDDIDGVGTTSGPLAPQVVVPVPPTTSDPMSYTYTFNIAANSVTDGVYQLTAVINHSSDANPAHLTEMVGFAESGPVKFTTITAETPDK
jgi:hypothetical protein